MTHNVCTGDKDTFFTAHPSRPQNPTIMTHRIPILAYPQLCIAQILLKRRYIRINQCIYSLACDSYVTYNH